MTKDYKAAYRYARSFFVMMKKKGKVSETHEELRRVLGFAQTHPEFNRLLLVTTISSNEKEELIDHILSHSGQSAIEQDIASLETRNFIKLLVKKKRYNLFEKIVESLHELFNIDLGIEEVTVVSPYPISGDFERQLKQVLEKKLERKVVLSTKLDASLLGGIVLYTRDQVVDGSLKEKLRGLKQTLISSGKEA